MAIAREVGNRDDEGRHLGSLSETLIDAGRYTEATQRAWESIKFGEEISNPRIGSGSNYSLANAHLCAGDLPAARGRGRDCPALRRA